MSDKLTWDSIKEAFKMADSVVSLKRVLRYFVVQPRFYSKLREDSLLKDKDYGNASEEINKLRQQAIINNSVVWSASQVNIYVKYNQLSEAWGFVDREVCRKYLDGELSELDLAALETTNKTVANIKYEDLK